MINGVNTYSNANQLYRYQTNKNTAQKPVKAQNQEEQVSTSIFYINDIHGRLSSMRKIATISNVYDSLKYFKPTDTLKLSSGDMMIGTDEKLNSCVNLFLNSIGVSSNVLGNHEFNSSPASIDRVSKNAKYKLLGMNLSVAPENALYSRIEKAYVEEKNGHKYGIIGISPPDLYARIGKNTAQKEVKVDDYEKTLKDVQQQVDEFQKQGINKIIVLFFFSYD